MISWGALGALLTTSCGGVWKLQGCLSCSLGAYLGLRGTPIPVQHCYIFGQPGTYLGQTGQVGTKIGQSCALQILKISSLRFI